MGVIGCLIAPKGAPTGRLRGFAVLLLSLRSCGVFVNQMTVQKLDDVPTPQKT